LRIQADFGFEQSDEFVLFFEFFRLFFGDQFLVLELVEFFVLIVEFFFGRARNCGTSLDFEQRWGELLRDRL